MYQHHRAPKHILPEDVEDGDARDSDGASEAKGDVADDGVQQATVRRQASSTRIRRQPSSSQVVRQPSSTRVTRQSSSSSVALAGTRRKPSVRRNLAASLVSTPTGAGGDAGAGAVARPRRPSRAKRATNKEKEGETSVWMVDLASFVDRLLQGLVKPHDNFVPDAVPRPDELKAEQKKVRHSTPTVAPALVWLCALWLTRTHEHPGVRASACRTI